MTEINKSEVVNRTERANSFRGRYSGVGSEFTIYFDTEEELKRGIDIVMSGKLYFETKMADKKVSDIEAMYPAK
jgi:hypothetical protein